MAAYKYLLNLLTHRQIKLQTSISIMDHVILWGSTFVRPNFILMAAQLDWGPGFTASGHGLRMLKGVPPYGDKFDILKYWRSKSFTIDTSWSVKNLWIQLKIKFWHKFWNLIDPQKWVAWDQSIWEPWSGTNCTDFSTHYIFIYRCFAELSISWKQIWSVMEVHSFPTQPSQLSGRLPSCCWWIK